MKRSKPANNQENINLKGSQLEIIDSDKEQTQEILITLNIKLIIQNENKKFIEEMIEQFPINQFLSKHNISSKRTLILAKVIQQLKTNLNFPLQSNFILFYLDMAQIFMKCGKDPISPDIRIRSQHFKNKNFITLKAINKGHRRSYQLMRPQNSNANLITQKNLREQEQNNCGKEKQTKIEGQKGKGRGGHGNERKIGYIIYSVQQWQRIYKQGNISLENAAKQVKIPKKTLDGYLYQLKMGQCYRFNFTEHAEEKIGLLRDFVKIKNNQEIKKKQEKLRKKLKKQEQKYLNKFLK